jgi:hypothetical protein
MIVQHMSNKVFIEVLIFVNYIQITIIPLSLINTTPLTIGVKLSFCLRNFILRAFPSV